MRRFNGSAWVLIIGFFLSLSAACSKSAPENPFDYPFIKQLHLKRQGGKPYSDYKAFYVLTEDFEPAVESESDVSSIRDVLRFASSLSAGYRVPWTHFIDVNTLTNAFVSDDQRLKQGCREMINDLKAMADAGDDCEMHLHGPLNPQLLEELRSEKKLHVKGSGAEAAQRYRQRQSFFFQSFYRQGYRDMVASLTYGKSLLEGVIYDGKKQVLAFRPGGWDHGSSSHDTLLYFHALSDSGFSANSGLSTGDFGAHNWRVGHAPGRNLAIVELADQSILEISPTAEPEGYVNPATRVDLANLAGSVRSEMPVILSVYHLGALQESSDRSGNEKKSGPQQPLDLQIQREALEQHFKTVADLAAAKILYPLTLRDLLPIISDQR